MADRRRLGPLAVSRGEPSPIDARRHRSRSTGVPRGRRRSLGVGQLESARDRRHRPLDTGSAQRRDRARPRQRRAQRHPARERGGAGLQAIAAAFGRRPSRRAATRPAVGGELRNHGDDRSRRRPGRLRHLSGSRRRGRVDRAGARLRQTARRPRRRPWQLVDGGVGQRVRGRPRGRRGARPAGPRRGNPVEEARESS